MGAMMIGNPSGRVDRFTADDVKLFETLANNTSVALENDRLGHTVWRMKELQRELEHQASHDPLTDLANRLLFAERVSEALERDPESVSVIFIDINDFKTINDTLGHAAGDELLIAISRRPSGLRPAVVALVRPIAPAERWRRLYDLPIDRRSAAWRPTAARRDDIRRSSSPHWR